MNKENAAYWEKILPLKLMDAIQNTHKWGEVLEIIMRMTGAKGAIITLRDKQTCQIVNDVELEQKFHSPLIRGFSTEEIVHYLTELRTIDPWAEFQRTYYPHRPIQMSKVCPQESIPDQRFFHWLKSVGFQDTIVFELDRMAGYWTAINLFIEDPNDRETRKALDFANEYYELIRNAWVTSQTLSKTRQSSAALLDRAAGAGSPTAIVGANGELLESNDLFDEMLETGAIRVSGAKRKLSFAHSVSVVGIEQWAQHAFLRYHADTNPLVLLASPLDPDPIFAGKRESHWLLTCTSAGATATESRSNLKALTRQERDLYNGIAQGQSVEQAGRAISLKRSRSFEVWSSVKDKLGIKSAHQLRR
ncbi:hypothetical protein AN191_16385 [Loktanella sp. 5RATIMAR09]|uniref:hypothetical protein n=1 Tax=Loktanella sp. 5RATIMAR09 TaxID=1225655 RepID=UPI0006EBB16E|nr:hypothetical protein [Loktanella sp. 5RATIMAR09]KQI70756.1 hypothetical protein AN191_16385 [Loktanella sp. 5RATIMAR09]